MSLLLPGLFWCGLYVVIVLLPLAAAVWVDPGDDRRILDYLARKNSQPPD